METIWRDVRFALRQLRSAPGFALTAVLTLGLAIGANTAIFSLLDQALLRLLPVHDPRQLVLLEGTGKAWEGHTSTHGGATEAYFSYPMYRDLRDQTQAFDGLIATDQAQVGVAYDNHSELANAELVSGNYFDVLGVRPALGRTMTQQDDLTQNVIRQTIQQIDSKLVPDTIRTLDSQIDDNISTQRIIAMLAVGFGVLATLLAAIGLYGVLAFSTTQRTRKIGIRMALGSDRLGVVKLMLLDVLKLAGISILVTIPTALLLTRALKSQLYHVSTSDPAVLAAVIVIVAVVAFIAAAVPARRAASIEPSKALRAE